MSKPMKEKNTTEAAEITPHRPKEVGSRPSRSWVSGMSLAPDPALPAGTGSEGGTNGVQLAGST